MWIRTLQLTATFKQLTTVTTALEQVSSFLAALNQCVHKDDYKHVFSDIGIFRCHFIMTSLKVTYHVFLTFKNFSTWTTAKLFHIQVCWLTLCQSICCIEVLWNFGHSLQRYNFTPSWRSKCTLSWQLRLNFLWQISHVNQVPSLCDFSRCVSSWSRLVKHSEQCLHEWLVDYGFGTVPTWRWLRTCIFRYLFVLNDFPQ